jgi:hypothetical protein
VPAPVTRFRVSRYYLWAGLVALGITAFSAWVAWQWPFAWLATGLAAATTAVFLFVALRPDVEIHESHLKLGRRTIPWPQIRRLDRSATLPLIMRLTLADKSAVTLVYAGDFDSAASLLRHLRRYAREALIDGVPYRQFWGEATPPGPSSPPTQPEKKLAPPPRSPLMLPEDEAEVERLFQRLKTVGHLDPKRSSEEK